MFFAHLHTEKQCWETVNTVFTTGQHRVLTPDSRTQVLTNCKHWVFIIFLNTECSEELNTSCWPVVNTSQHFVFTSGQHLCWPVVNTSCWPVVNNRVDQWSTLRVNQWSTLRVDQWSTLYLLWKSYKSTHKEYWFLSIVLLAFYKH